MRYIFFLLAGTSFLNFFVVGLWPVLRESDPRLAALSVKERNEVLQKPQQMLLKYQGSQGNFLVFYDYAGEVIYLRYRLDRWDFKTKDLPKRYQRGLTYRVDFSVEGFVFDPISGNEDPQDMQKVFEKAASAPNNQNNQNQTTISAQSAIAVGQFGKAEYILPELLR